MKLESWITRADKMERKRAGTDLLDATEGMLSQHKAALVSRIVKEVVAGRITVDRGDRTFASGEDVSFLSG
ncbi:hypothetical protein ACYX34_00865 [Nitrospira sp. CMX1]|nr:hypothetical protein [Nitrospira sp.]MBS0167568.1 hypothetical protein [Nitrospira sp.]